MTKKELKTITSICVNMNTGLDTNWIEYLNQLVNLNPFIFKKYDYDETDADFVANQVRPMVQTLRWYHKQVLLENNPELLRYYTDACHLFTWYVGCAINRLDKNDDYAKSLFEHLENFLIKS